MALLVPAILAKTPEEFTEKLNFVAPFCKKVQVDIMDGLFVPNKTITVSEIPKFDYPIKIELHMMTKDPFSVFKDEKNQAVNTVIMHYEALENPEKAISELPKHLIKGIALNPETPISVLKPIIKQIDLVLLMSVNPGFDGQEFIPSTLLKIIDLHNMRQGIIIEVDGGVNKNNAADIANAGADQVVVGSLLYRTNNIKQVIKNLMLDLGDIEGVGI